MTYVFFCLLRTGSTCKSGSASLRYSRVKYFGVCPIIVCCQCAAVLNTGALVTASQKKSKTFYLNGSSNASLSNEQDKMSRDVIIYSMQTFLIFLETQWLKLLFMVTCNKTVSQLIKSLQCPNLLLDGSGTQM